LRYFDDDYNDYHDLSLKGRGMGAQNWTVAEAKAKFGEIIDRAMSEGPQTITRKGRTAAVWWELRVAAKNHARR
jgi:Antitoxin Phd_YefM, type II toxin-antitoxin system